MQGYVGVFGDLGLCGVVWYGGMEMYAGVYRVLWGYVRVVLEGLIGIYRGIYGDM